MISDQAAAHRTESVELMVTFLIVVEVVLAPSRR